MSRLFKRFNNLDKQERIVFYKKNFILEYVRTVHVPLHDSQCELRRILKGNDHLSEDTRSIVVVQGGGDGLQLISVLAFKVKHVSDLFSHTINFKAQD